MATITLNYDARNKNAQNFINLILSLELAKVSQPVVYETGLEEALDDVAKGRISRVHTPKNWTKK